jgi:hypothetical protein
MYITLTDAARKCGITRAAVSQAARSKSLRSSVVAGRRVTTAAWVDDWRAAIARGDRANGHAHARTRK